MILRLSLFISILALITGCVTSPMSLTKQTQENIKSVDNILFIPQNNLDVTVPSINPNPPGLLDALIVAGIDSVRQSNAEKEAAPITKQLQNYDFRTVMLNTLSSETLKITAIKFNTPTHLETINSDTQQRISFDQSNATAVLFTSVSYRLESGNLIIMATVEMYPKSENLLKLRKEPDNSNPLDKGNVIYRKIFTFTKQAIIANNIKDSLSEGAVSIAQQISADLSHPL